MSLLTFCGLYDNPVSEPTTIIVLYLDIHRAVMQASDSPLLQAGTLLHQVQHEEGATPAHSRTCDEHASAPGMGEGKQSIQLPLT
jgi:hypothetical protein